MVQINSSLGQEVYQVSLEQLLVAKSKEMLKKQNKQTKNHW